MPVPILLRVFLISAVGLPVMCDTSQAQADPTDKPLVAEPQFVDPPGGTTAWLVQSTTGRVFATLADSDQVVEYDSAGQEVRRFKVGAEPQEMVLKSNHLVVACTKSPALHFIDLSDNQVAGELPFSGTGPWGLFASAADNPYIYCFAQATGSSSSLEVYQVDISTRAVRNQAQPYRWGQSSVQHVTMSQDGHWIVLDARGKSSPSGADLLRVDEDTFTFTHLRRHHDSFGQMVAGPFNRYWTFGNQLYPLDITKPVRSFRGSVVRIHPQFNLVAGYSSGESDELHLEQFSDSAAIAKVELPKHPSQTTPPASGRSSSRSRSRIPQRDALVAFDQKHNMVFVGTPARGYWIALEPLRASLQPLRLIVAPSQVSTTLGKSLRVPLQVTSEDGSERLEIVKSKGPDSIKVSNTSLEWTPTAEDIGMMNITLELRSKTESETLDSTDLLVQVKLPRIELGFIAKTMVRSPNNRFVIVWGPSAGQEQRHPAHTGSDDVAVIDIQQRKILANRTIPAGIRCAAIDAKYVFLSPNSGNLFYRFDHSLENPKRQFLQSTPKELVKFVGNRLAVIGDTLETFDTDKMSAVSMGALGDRDPRQNPFQLLTHNELRLGGRIIERTTGKVLRLDASTYLPPIPPAVSAQAFAFRPHPSNVTEAWGRKLTNNALLNFKDSVISQFSHQQTAALSERWPLAVLISTIQDPQTRESRLVMELRNLVDGTVMHSAVLDVFTPTQSGPHFYGANNLLGVTDDEVLYLHRDQLLIAEIPVNIAEPMPQPTHFLSKQISEIEVDGVVDVPLQVAGNPAGVTFSLMNETPHLQLDAKKGVLKVDTDQLWETLVSQSNTSSYQFSRTPVAWLQAAENARRYETLTGNKLPAKKMAAYLPISVVLQDQEGQQNGIQFSLVVVGPRDEFDRAAAQREAEEEQRREQARQAQLLQQQQMAEARAAALNAKPENADARIEKLEAQVRRLEAAIDSILKKLDDAP